MESDADDLGLEETPTYALAVTAFLFILVSLAVERGINRLKKYLKRKNQKPLRKVLVKMTEELMLLGFISLLLTVLQNPVVKLCMPANFAKHLLPCRKRHFISDASAPAISRVPTIGRRLFFFYDDDQGSLDLEPRRQLLTQNVTATGHCSSQPFQKMKIWGTKKLGSMGSRGQCEAFPGFPSSEAINQGKVPFISLEVLHQLHIFIFVLAVTHVCYSFVTICLGFARLQRWQRWEQETKVDGFDGAEDLENRYRKILQSERHYYGRHSNAYFDGHNHSCYSNSISIWIVCFFQQFFQSVSREDYLVLRVRFMNNHNLSEPFNFWEYVIRSMQVEFKIVIGISWWLWIFVTLFLLLNIHGWDTHFWVAFIPTIIVLIIGTTQQHIISTLSLQAKRHAADVIAAETNPETVPRPMTETDTALCGADKLFWFDNSRLVLRLVHFVMFQNSFELALFVWMLTDVGWNSCIMGNHKLLLVRLSIGLIAQLLASYSTLPIYALVTQMGSQMKETIFTKHVYENLKQWKAKATRISVKRQSERSSSQEIDQPDRTTASAELSTEASQPVESSTELTIEPEEGTSEPGPREPNPELVRRFQKMYGKVVAAQKFKLARQNDPR